MNGITLVVVKSLTLLAVACAVRQQDVQLKTTDPALFQQDPPNTGINNTCQVWSTPIPNSGGACECGSVLNGVVECDSTTHRTHLKSCYCMSYIEPSNSTVVGACLYTCFSWIGTTEHGLGHILLPLSTSQLSDQQCGYVNREGLLCGSCKNGFSPTVYSYDLRCVNSTECSNNNMWVKYIIVGFLSLTVFYIIVIIFRISATSPKMNGFVFVCQLMSAPLLLRALVLDQHLHPNNSLFVGVMVYSSITGIWNLDFFRMVYSPFCLNPHTGTLQVLALDYVVAIYPLVLIGLTYALVELHDNNFRIIVWIWKPFHKCFVLFRRQWDIRTSLIDAFATFLLLSYAKLLSVSFDILYPTPIYNESGKPLNKSYLYFDATVEYFGKEHLPYAITAIVVLLVFIIICPLLLLCLYPCRCFQKCLNHCRLQCHMLQTFMDAFQGCYKDGTNGTRDCRYFAGVYLVVRIASFSAFAVSLPSLYFPIASVIFVTFALLTLLVQPYRSRVYNVVDTVFVFTLVLGCFGGSVSISMYTEINYLRPVFILLYFLTLVIALFFPHIYMTGLLLYWLLVHKGCLRRVRNKFQCLESRRTHSEESLPDRLLNPEEYVQLPQTCGQ